MTLLTPRLFDTVSKFLLFLVSGLKDEKLISKKAQLSLTNPRYAKACQKFLKFDVLTTLSLTVLVCMHTFRCCCVRNLRNPEKFSENSNL